MEFKNTKDYTQSWRSIVSIVMILGGCACFVISTVCSMIIAKKQK